MTPEPRLQLADLIDHHERLQMIEGVSRMAEFGNGKEGAPESPKTKADLDYDFILKKANAHYDRYAECLRIADPEQRQAAYDQFEAKLNETEKQTRSQARILMLKLTRTGRSTLVAEKLQSLTTTTTGLFRMITAKSLTYYDLWKLSFALGEYRRKHRKFPAALSELVPAYLAKLPVEQYTDEPLKYQTDGKSLLLYSVRRDNEDHQGYEGNAPNDVFCDDLAVYTVDRRPQAPKAKAPPEFTDE